MRIGISLYGLRIPGIYDSKETFVNTLNNLVMISNVFEIPLLPLAWIPSIGEYKENNVVEFNTMHMPKNFFGLSSATRFTQLKQARVVIDKLGVSTIVFHPSERTIDEFLVNSIDVLTKKEEQIAFELCTKTALKQENIYFNNPSHKYVIDLAHLMRMNIQPTSLDITRISHIHVRGYNKKVHYVRLYESLEIIRPLISFFKTKGFSGDFILEYPYESINDIKSDFKALQSII